LYSATILDSEDEEAAYMSTRNRGIFLGGLLSLAVMLGACSLLESSTPQANTVEGKKRDVIYEGEGVAYGIQRDPKGKLWRTYEVSADSPFEGLFFLDNQQPTEEYLLTCLIDYRQLPCDFEGQQQTLFPITVGDFESQRISFKTPRLSPGRHDVALLAFAKPNTHDLSRKYRLSTDFNYLYAPRMVALVGEKPWQKPSMKYVTVGITPTTQTRATLGGLLVNQEAHPQKWRAWLTEEVQPGETVEYYVHMGGSEGSGSNAYAVMAFLDFIQVPLDGKNQWVAYASVPPGTVATLPGRFKAPTEPGVHEFVIVWAFDPYQLLEEPIGGPDRTLTRFSDFIEPSIRVALVVSE